MDAYLDKVFKALADPGRRLLIDHLHANNSQTLGQLCEHLDMTRQAVTKHLKLLEEAGLVFQTQSLHYLFNPSSIYDIAARWTQKPEPERHRAFAALKKRSDGKANLNDRTVVYAIHIAVSPERLWEALTSNEFWQNYWDGEWTVESEWESGSPLTFYTRDGQFLSRGEVLMSQPPSTLVYTWPNPEDGPEIPSERLIWRISRSGPGTVFLSLIHYRLSEAYHERVGDEWAAILSSLKSLLETGTPLSFDPRGKTPRPSPRTESPMPDSRFVYVSYIRTTPAKLWQALIDPEFTRRYWAETWQDCDWKPGSSWRLMIPDGRVGDSGEILEIEPGRRLVLTWRNEFQPELRAEGYSRLTCELEPQGDMVKLTIIHEMDREDSKLIEGVSGGWPMILSSLKSLLETGESLEATRRWPEGI